MNIVELILLVFAFVLFVIATFNVPSRFNLIAAGLAFWSLAVILSGPGAALVR